MEWGFLVLALIFIIVSFLLFRMQILIFKERKNCSIEIVGQCIKHCIVSRGRSYRRVIEFNYVYMGKSYYRKTSLDYIPKKKRESYVVGETYKLYVDPVKPKNIRCTDKIYYVDEVLSLGVYAFVLVISTFGMLGYIISKL